MRNLLIPFVLSFAAAVVGCGRSDGANDSELLSNAENSASFVVIGNGNTFLKKTKDDSSTLDSGSEKCAVSANTKLLLSTQPAFSGNHYFVKTAELLPDCKFKEGYIFTGHVTKTSIKSMFSGNMKAFLDVIAYAEGTGDSYNYIFSFATFSSYFDHPRRLICSGGYCSDAAGRYQIKSTTWDDVRRTLGLTDFSPWSQDRAAVQLIKWRGAYDDVERIDGPNSFADALYGVRYEWASLPHSPYGQPIKSVGELWSKFQLFRGRY
jgi:muramidase (phage lysozyme)